MRALEDVQTVAVIGAGSMGSGIAQVAAIRGYDVILRDVEETFLESGLDSIQYGLDRLVANGSMSETEAESARERIDSTTSMAAVADADLVVEAIVEDLAIKQEAFQQVDEITDDDVVLASNTSTLSITSIASVTERPELVIGIHFMNPVPLMEGVEVVVGEHTSAEAVSLAHEFAEHLGKTTWESTDKPGFIVNRVLMPWINEGVRALDEGVGTKEDIDRGLKLGTNVPMGPLELADHIGLDVVLDASETLHRELGDRYQPAYLVRRKVEAGDLGKKSGRGFYEYED